MMYIEKQEKLLIKNNGVIKLFKSYNVDDKYMFGTVENLVKINILKLLCKKLNIDYI